MAFKTDCLDKMVECKTTIEQCVRDVDNWMVINKLKLNQDKTEVVLISLRYRPRRPLDSLQIGNVTVVPSSSARNLRLPLEISSPCRGYFLVFRECWEARGMACGPCFLA